MSDSHNLLDHSDDIRELINNESVDSCSSVHQSDIDSDVGELLDDEIFNEVGVNLVVNQNVLEEQCERYNNDGEVNDEQDGFVEVNEEQAYDSEAVIEEEAEINGEEDLAVGGDEDEEEAAEGDGWREWTDNDVRFSKYIYANNSGFRPPRGPMPQTEKDFFQLFFTDTLLSEIVSETNRYAKEKIMKNTPLKKRSIWWSWKDVTLPEMKAFLAVLINMGMNPKPEIEDYFSSDYVDYQPFFKDTFSKDRFHQIFWNLHVSPPHSSPVGGFLTRSGKVRRVVQYLDKKFRQYYIPKHKVSVDESTVAFKGRVCFKVYNKDKPIKWGIKIWVMSESATGYICGLEPYLGKITTDRMCREDLGVTSRVVLHLVEKLEEDYGTVEGLHVFTDRLYTNVELADALHEKKVHITGTIVRTRKGLPPQVRPTRKGRKSNKKKQKKVVPTIKLKKGEIKAFRKDDKLSLLIWRDTNDVTMLTTLYDTSTQTVRRVKKGGVVEAVQKPTVVCKYNESMGGVDLTDQYISSYAFLRKSVKWWRKIFFWLLETGIVNSFILFNSNQTQGKKVTQRKFRKQLVKQLVGEVRNTNKRLRPSNISDEQRLNGSLHVMYPLEERKTKDCAVCSDRTGAGVRRRTKFFCNTCDAKPGLCPGICFENYHTKTNFKE